MGTTRGNFLAQRNGRAVEVAILGKQVSSHHVLDSPKLEVKTAQEWVNYKGRSSGKRRGSFVLYDHQHRQLLVNGGSYLFVVLDDTGNIIHRRKISARKIERAFKIMGRKQVTLYHTTVFDVGREP